MERERKIRDVTLAGGAINLLLVLFKFCAGVLGSSSAMIADAAHSLSDFASDIIVLLCIRISGKPADADHPYGHAKFETLASVVIGALLLATGIGIFWDGCSTIIASLNGEAIKTPTYLALVAAVVSIAVKEGLYHYTMHAAIKLDSAPLKANAWHHRSDALSSISTLAGIGGAMWLGGKWSVLDPLAACLISLFILWMAICLMKPGLDELMEKSLPETDKRLIEEIISGTPGVKGHHRLRTRRMGVNRAIEAHLKLEGGMTLAEAHDVATEVERRLKARLGRNTHVGLHMEPAAGKAGASPGKA